MQPTQLRAVCHYLSVPDSEEIALMIDRVFKYHDITSLKLLQMFVAQTAHESGEYKIKGENLNYSSVERLKTVWPSHFNNGMDYQRYVHDPQALGEFIYGTGSIARDLGNIKPADGWMLRGSGPLQCTGRNTFTGFFKWCVAEALTANTVLTDDALYHLADLVREDREWGFMAAGWEFFVDKALQQHGLSDWSDHKLMSADLRWFTIRINGGLNGLDSRLRYLEDAVEHITEL